MASQILKHPDDRLRIVSEPFVVGRKLRNPSSLNKVRELIDAMYDEGGIGLAAPQMGWHTRIVVIRMPMFDDALVLINPYIMGVSDQQDVQTEMCLSVPGKAGKVKRPVEVRVGALVATTKAVREGKPVLVDRVMDFNQDPARCVQHEMDHLDGRLYIDKAIKVWDLDQKTPKLPL